MTDGTHLGCNVCVSHEEASKGVPERVEDTELVLVSKLSWRWLRANWEAALGINRCHQVHGECLIVVLLCLHRKK